MADLGKETIYCGPCEYENVTKLAAKWCSDCEEGYCDECLRLHKAAKMSRHHHLVPVAEYQNVEQFAIPQVCQVHQKVFEYFCPGHDSVICILCVKSDHSKCPDPLSLQNAAKGVKTSTALTDLEQNIDNLLGNIENGINIQDKNLSSILENEKSIKIAVKTKHEEIIQYFEKLYEKTLAELTAKYGQCQQEISSAKSTFIKKQTELRNVKDRILQMKTSLSNVQAFLGMKTMIESVNEENAVVKSLVTDMSSLVLKFEPNLKKHISIENIEKYGTSLIATTKGCASFVEPKVEQAQFKITSVTSVESIQLQLKMVINLKHKHCFISSCLILPNKQMMILDETKNCLMIYNENGSHDRDIRVPGKPFDATIIDHRTVAVTYGNKIISIVDINSNRTKRNIEIAVKHWCWGIAHNNGKLYVLCFKEGISVLDLSGCIFKKIPVDVSKVYRLICTSRNIIYTNTTGSLFCLNMDGNPLWNFTSSKLVHSCQSSRITADEKGNVYLVGEQSNVLIAASKEGETQNVLLTEQEGLIKPNAINYSEEHKLLLICNKGNGHVALYDV